MFWWITKTKERENTTNVNSVNAYGRINNKSELTSGIFCLEILTKKAKSIDTNDINEILQSDRSHVVLCAK